MGNTLLFMLPQVATTSRMASFWRMPKNRMSGAGASAPAMAGIGPALGGPRQNLAFPGAEAVGELLAARRLAALGDEEAGVCLGVEHSLPGGSGFEGSIISYVRYKM